MGPGGVWKKQNIYKLVNLRALKFSYLNKIHIFQGIGKIFCVVICYEHCPPENATRHHWWLVNIGSGDGLVPSGSKPLPEPMFRSTSPLRLPFAYDIFKSIFSRWRHQMESFSALLAICAGNSPVTCDFPSQRPVTRSLDVFFDLRLNERLSKQSWGCWFETLSRPLWRHCNVERSPMGCCRHENELSSFHLSFACWKDISWYSE